MDGIRINARVTACRRKEGPQSMSTPPRAAGAVAAGYALGRFKKLRLAVLVATAMSSPKFRNAAVGLIQDRIPGGAVVGALTKEGGGKIFVSGHSARTRG